MDRIRSQKDDSLSRLSTLKVVLYILSKLIFFHKFLLGKSVLKDFPQIFPSSPTKIGFPMIHIPCCSGIYFGLAQVPSYSADIFNMVMSCGWNPFYQNERLSAETHIIHQVRFTFHAPGNFYWSVSQNTFILIVIVSLNHWFLGSRILGIRYFLFQQVVSSCNWNSTASQ